MLYCQTVIPNDRKTEKERKSYNQELENGQGYALKYIHIYFLANEFIIQGIILEVISLPKISYNVLFQQSLYTLAVLFNQLNIMWILLANR